MRLERVMPFVIALLGFAVIGPALWSGWLGDDAFYSALDGMLGADRISLWQAMLHAFGLWFLTNGRFYPGLILEKYLVFSIFTNLLAYKALLVAATLATLELFRRCVAAYATQALADLAALVAASLLCERGYQDAILSYNAMPQVVAMLVLTSLLAFQPTFQNRGGFTRVTSIALYALAALTYEDAYGFCLLYLGLATAVTRSLRLGLRLSWPYLAIAAGLAVFSLAARAAVHVPAGSLYAFSLDPVAALRTFVEQATAALPLSYWLFDPQHIFSRSSLHNFYNDAPVQPLLFIAFALAAGYALGRAGSERVNPRGPVSAGALAVVLAAFPIAVMLKYQRELQLGLGYLPVLFEVLGVALALAAIATWSLSLRGGRWFRPAWIVAIALIATMTQATNVRIVRGGEAAKVARDDLERQLDHGMLHGVSAGSAIAVSPMPDWMVLDDAGPDGISTRDLFFMHAGVRVDLVAASDPRANLLLRYDAARRQWSVTRL